MAKSRTTWRPRFLPPDWGKLHDYDRGWIAALIDGEGCLAIEKNGPTLQISNTSLGFLQKAQKLIGGSIQQVPMSKLSKKAVYRLTLRKTLLLWLLPQIELFDKEEVRRAIMSKYGR